MFAHMNQPENGYLSNVLIFHIILNKIAGMMMTAVLEILITVAEREKLIFLKIVK